MTGSRNGVSGYPWMKSYELLAAKWRGVYLVFLKKEDNFIKIRSIRYLTCLFVFFLGFINRHVV